MLSRSLNEIANQADGANWKHDRFATDTSRPSPRLIISNLFYEVSERELELLFIQIGPLASGPTIQFDRSGRSRGTATVTYQQVSHAIKAKQSFDGAPAKGQEIKVTFDLSYRPPPPTPEPGSLLARLEPTSAPKRNPSSNPFDNPRPSNTYEPPHKPRSSLDAAPKSYSASRPRLDLARGGLISRGGGRGGAVGAGGRGGSARGAAVARGGGAGRGGRGGKAKQAPKSADDLDRELEAFMKVGGDAPAPAAAAAAPAVTSGDVDMA